MARYTSSNVYFDGRRRFKPGEVFDLPEGQKPGRGMVKVEADKPKADKPKGKGRANEPATLSEVAKADSDAMGKELNG